MNVSESYPSIHLGGLSNRILSKNWYYVFQEQKHFVLKIVLFTLGLGISEEVSEASRSGKG